MFATLNASEDFLRRLSPEDWRDIRDNGFPTSWTAAQRDDGLSAAQGTCWLLQGRNHQSPDALLKALERVERHCAALRDALAAVPLPIWLHGDAAGLDGTAAGNGEGGPSIGLGSLVHLAADDLSYMGDPLLFPSDLARQIVPMLDRLALNARAAKALFPPLDRSVKPVMAARRFVVGRMAEACEAIGGKPLAPTGPEWFIDLMRKLGPAAGVDPIGVEIVRAVLIERHAVK